MADKCDDAIKNNDPLKLLGKANYNNKCISMIAWGIESVNLHYINITLKNSTPLNTWYLMGSGNTFTPIS